MKATFFPSTAFDWKKDRASTSLGRLGVRSFPRSFYIRSARTNKTRLFLYDPEVNEENEFFDGEATAYFSPGEGLRVTIWA